MKKILLVDDSNTVIMMQQMMLKELKYELAVARSGEEALEKAAAEKPDLIFMDVMMPGMSGFDACRKLREREETRATPIIMVTTRGEPANVDAGFAAGCSEYILKPFDKAELLTKLRMFLKEPA